MKEKTNKILILIIICLCLVIVAGVVWFVAKGKNTSGSGFEPELDVNATKYIEKEEMEEPDGIRIPGYPTITIPAKEINVPMNLMNPEGNPCYFTFEIMLKEEEETIYTSKMVEPGKAITNVTLTRELPKGEYEAVIKISTASLEDGTAMNGANVETLLIVE